MSGGVDSSVAALRLCENGFNVVGLTLKMWRLGIDSHQLAAVDRAKEVCERLGIRHIVTDVGSEFEEVIVKRFVDEYLSGRTPNPCVNCNSDIKWKAIINLADSMNFDLVATGHYARVFKIESTSMYGIRKGRDYSKEQSYALWRLSQDMLRRTVLPLGSLTKSEIISLAEDNDFASATAKENQEICFITDNDYRHFLKEYLAERVENIAEGEIVDDEGNVLGCHKGFYNFTIGQRKGLGIALGKRQYVKKIDPDANRVVLANGEELYSRGLILRDINWVSVPSKRQKMDGVIKIRYNHSGAECNAAPYRSDAWMVTFDEPQRAVTPGQSAVLYQGDVLVFGGVIQEAISN